VQTWDQVLQAIELAQGAIDVRCAAQASCIVSGGLGEIDLTSAYFSVWNDVSGASTLDIQAGTTLKGISGFSRQLVVNCISQGSPSLSWDYQAGFEAKCLVTDSARVQTDATATSPAIVVPDMTLLSFACSNGGGMSALTNGVPVVQVTGATGEFDLYAVTGTEGPQSGLSPFPSMPANPIVLPDAPGNGVFVVVYDASLVPAPSSASPSPWQMGTTFANFILSPIDNAANLNPSFGPTASRPPGPLTGQMFFDTTLAAGAGKPVWWDGSTWVDATGTPA
jgi:hypothetical protein